MYTAPVPGVSSLQSPRSGKTHPRYRLQENKVARVRSCDEEGRCDVHERAEGGR